MSSTQFIIATLWQAIGWTMLHYLWTGGLAALMASLVNHSVRRQSPEIRYAVALSQFAFVAFVPCCLFAWKMNQPAGIPGDGDASFITNVVSPVTVLESAGAGLRPAHRSVATLPDQDGLSQTVTDVALEMDRVPATIHNSPSSSKTSHDAARAMPAFTPAKTGFSAGMGRIMDLLPWIWVIGFPLSSLYLLAGISGAERFRHKCQLLIDAPLTVVTRRLQASLRISGDVAIGVAECLSTPVLVGIFRPLILLPTAMIAGLSTTQLEMILLHELAHVRRRDNLINLIQRLVESVLFFHPAIWWLSHRMRLEREHCCDAIVLAHINAPQIYAETLVQIAIKGDPMQAILATSLTQQLIPRIRQILKLHDDRLQVSRGLVVVAMSVFLSLSLVTFAKAQRNAEKGGVAPAAAKEAAVPLPLSDPQQNEPKANDDKPAANEIDDLGPTRLKPLSPEERDKFISIEGTILKDDGQPARWSQVWLAGDKSLPGGRYGAVKIEFSRADANGKFAFRHPRWRTNSREPDEFFVLWVMARTRNGELTTIAELNLTGEYRGKSEIHGLKLSTLPQADYSGRVVDQDGKPIPNSKVAPQFLILQSKQGNSGSAMPWFPELAELYTVETDRDGKFKLIGLPPSKMIVATISTPTRGTREMFWNADSSPELRIEPGAILRGKLTDLPDQEFFSNIQVTASTTTRLEGAKPGNLFAGVAPIEVDGSFEITDVPAGQYEVLISRKQDGVSVPSQFNVLAKCEAKSGEINELMALKSPKLISSHGRIIDRATGVGVAQAGVLFYEQKENHRMVVGMAKSDADGKYRAYVPPGKIAVEFGRAPDGYLAPINDIQSPAILREADFEGPTLKLQSAITIRGTVVDQDGQPVSAVVVRTIQPQHPGEGMRPEIKSGDLGTFSIPQIDPDEYLPLRVRTPSATSAAVVIQPGNLDKPQQIVISPQNAFRMKGTIEDQSGQPIPDADIAIHWHTKFVSKKTRMSGSSSEIEKLKTDAKGQFVSSALWPEDGYHVVVQAPGFRKTDLANVKGDSGQTYDYGTIRLNAVGHSVSGQVVDLEGKPISGVTVFNSGDAPAPVSTVSGKDGRFRLSGLIDGPVYLFAEHSQYRFGGTYVKRPAKDVRLTLTPLTAAPPQRKAIDTDVLEAKRREVAEKLLEWGKTTKPVLRPNLRDSKFTALAKTDPEETLKQIALQSPAMDYRSAIVTAKALTPFRPRKAVDENDKKNIVTALRFVERAVSRIKDLDANRRVFVTADAGLMYLRLGDAERGLPLIQAAEKEWSEKSGENAYNAITIAQGLAWTDVARALGMADKVSDEDVKATIRKRVILEVAKFDVPRARELMNDKNLASVRDSDNDSLRFDLAYRIGALEPQAAADLVTNIIHPRTRAEAAGWVAVAINDEKPELARSMIRLGLETLQNSRSRGSTSFYYEYVPGVAANLALQASQIKHPELESIIQRALALRIPADPHTTTFSRLQSSVNAALFLAFVDPAISRQLLSDIESQVEGKLLGNGGSESVGRREWLYAWVLSDPEHAAQLIQSEMENAKDSDQKTGPPFGIQDAITLMFLPPAERLDFVRMFSSTNTATPYPE